MAHRIEYADPDGIGARYGLRAGDTLIAVNGEEVLDEIDYQALTAEEHLDILLQDEKGVSRHVQIEKEDWEPLGLRMADTMICRPMICRNNCVFCFVAQMPHNMRDTLYVKDDDWRMSLMMGNFITLTNVDDREFDRILRRHATPLYISVHATEPELRRKLLRNPEAGRLMERLTVLSRHGIRFHCQVVLCPGLNDGPALERTLSDLDSLGDAVLSVALVPVGLTRFREKLEYIRPYTKETALQVMRIADAWREKCLRERQSRFVFPADEFYGLTGLPLPPDEAYEGYPQLENGVGMLRQFEDALRESALQPHPPARKRRVTIACGTSLAPFMQNWMEQYCPKGVTWKVKAILNDYFGHTVTVSGLLTGQDLLRQLRQEDTDEFLLSASCLRHEGDLFLDDMSISALKNELPAPLTLIHGGGDRLFEALIGTT